MSVKAERPVITPEPFSREQSWVVSSPDRFFPFLFVVAEKRVWWISVGRFVLQTLRF